MGKRRNSYEKLLKNYYGYDKLKDKQFKIIDNIIHKKRDIVAILATGFGKSICYQLPFLITNKNVIVISPLLSLMEDQYNDLESRNIPVCCLNSNNSNKNKDIFEILKGENKIIFMTPEYFSLSKKFLTNLYKKDLILCIAIDESHCISTWSDNSFRPEYKELSNIREWIPDIPILTLTATANEKVQQDIIKILDLKNPKIVKGSFDRKNLIINVKEKDKIDKYNEIIQLVNKFKNKFIIIYTKTRKDTEKISEELTRSGNTAVAYHAGLGKDIRNEIQKCFMSGKCKCIVATVAFGMGINNKHVRLVIHYGCPKNISSYYQEIGRAGRDGEKSECHLFYREGDFRTSSFFISKIEDKEFQRYSTNELNKIKDFVRTKCCRRKFILNHFEEDYDLNNCNSCDFCLNREKEIIQDLTKETKILLNLLIQLKPSIGKTNVILILRGSRSKKIKPYMTKLQQYNKGNNYKVEWWGDLIKILIENKYINEVKFSNKYGAIVLECSKLGFKLLKNEKIELPITEYMNRFNPVKQIEVLNSNDCNKIFEHFHSII